MSSSVVKSDQKSTNKNYAVGLVVCLSAQLIRNQETIKVNGHQQLPSRT